MEYLNFLDVLASVGASFALCLYLQSAFSRRRRPFPPGPTPIPLLGNILDMPTSREYETYAKWGKEYGDVAHVTVLGRHIVVLNSVKAANELFSARSAIYSNRAFIPMLQDPRLMDMCWSFVFQDNSPTWRRQRRLFSQQLGPTASRTCFEAQIASIHTLLVSLLHAPDKFVTHLRHNAARTIMAVAYGYEVKPTDDPWVQLAEGTVMNILEGARPGRYLVNLFPLLKYVPAWFPGASFKTFALKARKDGRKLLEMPFEDAQRRITEGRALPSFVTSCLSDPAPVHLITDIQSVAATMYAAASDTTVATMQACILGLVLTPSVQVRAQAELDVVLGPVSSSTFRLPTFADRRYLPYIDAIVKESLRWFPVTPTGTPHGAAEDDVYRGWKIPKGAVVIANAWSMLRDETVYSDPLAFRPERFLGERPEPHPALHGCFGFGRRECPGRSLAENSLWIQIASLIAVFTFSPAKDINGEDIDVSYAREPRAGYILYPQPFPCTITPRSKEAEKRVLETQRNVEA